VDESDPHDTAAFRKALFVAAAGLAVYAGYCLVQFPRVLREAEHVPRATCDELIRNGPGGRRHVTLTDACLSGGKSVSERDSESGALELYHPLYPSGLGKEPEPRDFRLILRVMDEMERRRVRDDRDQRKLGGRPGLSEFTCEVRKGAGHLPGWARSGLTASYPGIRPDDCWVVTVGEGEPTPAYARRLAWHGVGSLLGAGAMFVVWWVWRRSRNGGGRRVAAVPSLPG
jgi:hypothetical protein